MVSMFSILTNLLLVTVALAVQLSRLDAVRARQRENRQSQPSHRVNLATTDSMSTYTGNWAGAVSSHDPGTFTSVTAIFKVPIPEGNDGSAASVWVGIDGDTCQNAILQTGIDFFVSGGEYVYNAWYEWYPDRSYDFSGITISPGDNVSLTVTTFSTNSGQALVKNLSNGQAVTQQLSSSYALCQQDAEWIVEDFTENGGLVPFANFGSVTFSDASASGASGSAVDPASANLVDIEQNGQVLTNTYATGSSVTIEYVG